MERRRGRGPALTSSNLDRGRGRGIENIPPSAGPSCGLSSLARLITHTYTHTLAHTGDRCILSHIRAGAVMFPSGPFRLPALCDFVPFSMRWKETRRKKRLKTESGRGYPDAFSRIGVKKESLWYGETIAYDFCTRLLSSARWKGESSSRRLLALFACIKFWLFSSF